MPHNRTFRANSPDRHHSAVTGTYNVDLVSSVLSYALVKGVPGQVLKGWLGAGHPLLGVAGARLDDRVPHLALMRLGQDRPLSPDLADCLPSAALGGLAHGMQFAPTLGAALDFLIQHAALIGDRLTIRRKDTGAETTLSLSHPNDALDSGRLSSTLLALLARACTALSGDPESVARIALCGSSTDWAPRRLPLRCRVSFRVVTPELCFRHGAAELTLPTAQPDFFALSKDHVRRKMVGLGLGAGQLQDLDLLRQAISAGVRLGDFRSETILQRARLSRRSAQRLTAEHGTSLTLLIEDARRARAEVLLADRSISMERAALLLGYSDDRAFRRAFKRWTGLNPRAFRKTLSGPIKSQGLSAAQG